MLSQTDQDNIEQEVSLRVIENLTREKAASRAKKLLGQRCELCGYSKYVDAYFITPKSKGGTNSLNNIIILCPNHHKESSLGLISEEQLLSIVGKRGSLKNFF